MFINKVIHKICAQPEFLFGNKMMQQFPDKSLHFARVASITDSFSFGDE
jgi:hypothetical protein